MTNLSGNTYSREDTSLDRYLHEIGNEVLVSKEKEVELAQEIRNGSLEALDTLVKANLRFVVMIAKRYKDQGMSLCDLINEGNLGLIKAAKRFDGTKGCKFISYAVWWIRQSILTALAKETRIVRLPITKVGELYKINKTTRSLEQEFGRAPSANEIADELEMSPYEVMDNIRISLRHRSLDASFEDDDENNLLDVINDDFYPPPDEIVMDNSLKREIKKALLTLTGREAEVICMYFGINREKPTTLEDISKTFKISRERVRQIKEKALNRLRQHSSCNKLRTYILDLVPEERY